MSRYKFHLTETAFRQLDDIVYKTALDRGPDQAEKYKQQQLAGFDKIAQEHMTMRTEHREKLAKGTDFKVHLVEHHYAAYQSHDQHNVIIAGVFHERMDIPTQLRELKGMTRHEIGAIKRDIERSNAGRQAGAAPASGAAGTPGKAADPEDDPEGRRRAEYRARGEAAETKHDKAMDDKAKAPAQEPGQKPGQGQDIDD